MKCLSLNTSGDAMQSIRREARAIIREQLVVIKSGRCTADADLYRNLVYDNFTPNDIPFCKFRGAVIRKLWNGDIRKRGRIDHYCFGCCRSFGHTVSQMCNEGIRCCMGGGIRTLMRSNLTGGGQSIDSIGLPSHVQGLVQTFYFPAMPEPNKNMGGRHEWQWRH